MKRTFFILTSVFFLAYACSEDSFARYRLKASSLEILPDLDQTNSYRSVSDTLSMSVIVQGDYYEETNLPSPIASSDVDKVEVQLLTSVSSTDPLSNLIEYQFESIPSRDERTGSYDLIRVRLMGDNDLVLAELTLDNKDSLACALPSCRFADTLTIDSVNYFEVYYLAEDPQKPNIYINQSEGVVAFRGQQLETYQRIK